MGEYIVKTASASDWQKWLNQWRHKYKIEIVSMNTVEFAREMLVTMCIKRFEIGGISEE